MAFFKNVRRYLGVAAQNPPDLILATRAPLTSDLAYSIGDIWVDTSTNLSFQLTSVVAASANWTLLGPGSSDVDTLTGDTGGPIAPVGGNIDLLGGTNLATAGTAGTLTFNLDDAITLATSVTSPIYTSAAAMAINAPAGQNITIKMGDAAGANKVSFVDSASVEVAAIDSNGGFTMGAITFTGLLTALASATINTAGTALNLATDADTATVNIGTGAAARTINIGTSAQANLVNIGSVTGAAALTLKAGTGNFVLQGDTATTIAIGTSLTTGTITIGDTGNTGTMTISSSTGIQTVNIANSNGAKTINIGDGVSGNTITVANGINTSAQTVSIANGNSGADSTVSILSGTGTAGAGVLALGSNTRVTTIGIGNVAPAATRVTTVNGGNSAQDDTVSILNGNPSAGTQTVNILSGAASGGTQVLNLAAGASVKTVNLATGAAVSNNINIGGTGANVIAIGNTQTDGSVAVGSAMTTGTVSIGGTGAQTGTVTISASTGAQTIAIGNANGAKTINIGSGISGNTISIGNGANTSAQILNLAAGASGADSTVNVLSGNATAGTSTLNLATGTSVKVITIGGSGANTITIGNTQTGGSVAIGDAMTTGTIAIGGSGAQTGTITVAGGTGAQTINVANSTGGKTVNIATGAGANTVTLGSSNTTSTTTIQAGSGNVNVVGNLSLSSVATQFRMNGGAVTDFIGQAVLVNGVVTVANTNIAAADRIIVTRSAINASTALGHPLTTISAGASFTLRVKQAATPGSDETGDQSTFDYIIIRQT